MDLQEMVRQMLLGDLPTDNLLPLSSGNTMSKDVSSMSREERIDQHVQKVQELAKHITSTSTNFQWTSNSVQKPKSFSSHNKQSQLNDLGPISISELRVARAPYAGRVLFCTVATPCLTMASAMVLVEDENGAIADLAVYNYTADPNQFLYPGRRRHSGTLL